MVTVRPGPNCIEVDGMGGGVPISEIERSAKLFRELFGVEPAIRVTGRFERGAIGQVPGGDPTATRWDLREVMGSGFATVLSVGAEYLAVQVWTGMNNGRALALAPARGTFVKVRLSLPK